jgi:hypothetical protein
VGIGQPVNGKLQNVGFDIIRLLEAVLFKRVELWLIIHVFRLDLTMALKKPSVLADEAYYLVYFRESDDWLLRYC